MALSHVPPTDTRFLFRPVISELVALLRGLPPDAWERPTAAGRWRVRDVAAHLVDGGMRRLSFHRDGHPPPAPSALPGSAREFAAFINDLNERWVDVAGRLSPRMLTDLYEVIGRALADFTESLPLDGPALFPVSWAGEHDSAGWFDLGREFTEVWHHQAQIRDAVAAPVVTKPAWLHATLLIALRALPHAYRDTPAAAGESVVIDITGAAGGVWTLLHDGGRWTLRAGEASGAPARVTMSDDIAWRLLFNALPGGAGPRVVSGSGRPELVLPLLHARAVIV